MDKLFTPSQANKTLPLVRSIVDDILHRAKELRGKAALSKEPETDPELASLQKEVQRLMDELEALGCSFKDWSFDVGLVDFPAEVDGQRVLLCWRSDEASVTHYHPIDGGFASRQPIPAQLLEDGQ